MNDESTGAPWICPYDGPVPTRKCPYCGYDCKHSAAKDAFEGGPGSGKSTIPYKGYDLRHLGDYVLIERRGGMKVAQAPTMEGAKALVDKYSKSALPVPIPVHGKDFTPLGGLKCVKCGGSVSQTQRLPGVRPMCARCKAISAAAKDAKDPWYDARIKELEQEVARCKREGEPYADELRDIAEYKKERDDRARAAARSMSRDALPEPV